MLKAYSDHWALITGASSGIGAEFARRLAARGMHLILTGRRKELLDQLAGELHTHHGTKCEVIVGDLSDPAEPSRMMNDIRGKGIEIELLINNAGFGMVGEVEKTEVSRVLQLIRLNMSALTELTYLVLPSMIARKHGAVINVASVAGIQPVAFMPVYSASKAYVLHFSEALWAEVRGKGVTVMALCPGTTQTEFFDVAGAQGWLKKHRSQTVGEVVKTALWGLEKRRQYIIPGWGNYFLSLLVRIATRRTVVSESRKYFRPPPEKNEKS
ncbi:MAG: SDR family NAD(P)-dependent oxidoreductase [Planctomycetaceae bacterium]